MSIVRKSALDTPTLNPAFSVLLVFESYCYLCIISHYQSIDEIILIAIPA